MWKMKVVIQSNLALKNNYLHVEYILRSKEIFINGRPSSAGNIINNILRYGIAGKFCIG